jgi:hypothetical protein
MEKIYIYSKIKQIPFFQKIIIRFANVETHPVGYNLNPPTEKKKFKKNKKISSNLNSPNTSSKTPIHIM